MSLLNTLLTFIFELYNQTPWDPPLHKPGNQVISLLSPSPPPIPVPKVYSQPYSKPSSPPLLLCHYS